MREEAEQAAREASEAQREATRKAREAERQAAKQAKQAAREAEAAERKALLEQAYEKFAYKVRAYKNGLESARRSMGLPTKKRKWTPEQHRQWRLYLRESRKKLDEWLVGRMRRELNNAAKAARREHRRLVAEGKAEPSAEQLAREKRRHDKLMAYNRVPSAEARRGTCQAAVGLDGGGVGGVQGAARGKGTIHARVACRGGGEAPRRRERRVGRRRDGASHRNRRD